MVNFNFLPYHEKMMSSMNNTLFIWETHGLHVGTGRDHVKHGIDDEEQVIENAIKLGSASITFVIHTPRLTSFRYQSERDTEIKFIRGDSSYSRYARRMEMLKEKFRGRIAIRFGIELEWMGSGLGLQWSRSKLFQAHGTDFVIGSNHFSPEKIPYDGSKEDTNRLIRLRGGIEPFWAGYLDEMIEMVDVSRDMIQVVGHLDLPKIYAPVPEAMKDIEHSSHYLARRVCTLLEMISDLSLALDLNMAGLRKGCGVFPDPHILKQACRLGIPIAIGTDAHTLAEIGKENQTVLRQAREAGYKYYVSFSRGIPEKRPLNRGEDWPFKILNLGTEMLKRRFERERRLEMPRYSFGGTFKCLQEDFPDSASLGSFNAIRVRRDDRSVTLSDRLPDPVSASGLSPADGSREGKVGANPLAGGISPAVNSGPELTCLYSHHTDTPGTLSILFNTLASEEINVDTAYLNSLADGTATAFLTLSGPAERIKEAADFVMGTASDRFFRIDPEVNNDLPRVKKARVYLLEVDGVYLPIPISRQMIITVHNNRPGVLLILLSALASRNVNVLDLQLGERGDRGFAVLGVEGDENEISAVLPRLGPQYYEASQIVLNSFEKII